MALIQTNICSNTNFDNFSGLFLQFIQFNYRINGCVTQHQSMCVLGPIVNGPLIVTSNWMQILGRGNYYRSVFHACHMQLENALKITNANNKITPKHETILFGQYCTKKFFFLSTAKLKHLLTYGELALVYF